MYELVWGMSPFLDKKSFLEQKEVNLNFHFNKGNL